MKTVIRNSYTPKLGDYCETIVVDRENERAFIFDQDGVFTEMPQPIDVEDILRRAAEYTDSVVAPINEKLDTIEEGAQVNKIEHVLKNGTELTITNKTVNVTVPVKTSDLTNDGSDGTDTYVESATLDDYYTKDETDTQIGYETDAREIADAGLQEQIDAIVASSDVVDIVGTYAALQAYDTSKLHDNDIIKVLDDETRNDATTYYRWDADTSTWSYIGAEGPFYTKAETDAIFTPMTRTINNKALSSDITLTAADVGALPDSTVIPTVNDATLTIQQNGTTVQTFTANQATNATANITVPTDTSDLTNDGDGQSPFATEDYVDTYGGKIDVIEVNGTAQPIVNKTVDITVPTNTSDLTNDGADGTSTYVETNELGAAAFSNDYTDLDNLPTIPTVNNATLTIQKNGTDVATFTANSSTNQTANITVPTDTADLTNGAGFITTAALANYYTKNETYSQQEVNGLISAIVVPTKTSDLTNDGSTGTSTYVETSALGAVAFSNDYDDLDNLPTIPSYSDFIGATASTAGAHGLVPAPAAGDQDKYLKGDGTWATVQSGGGSVTTFYWGYDSGTATHNLYTQTYPTYVVATDADVQTAFLDGVLLIQDSSSPFSDNLTYVVTSWDYDSSRLGAASTKEDYTNTTTPYYVGMVWDNSTQTWTRDVNRLTYTAGTNITISNNTISASIPIDSALDVSSTNPVENSVVTAAINGKSDKFVIMKYGESNAWAKFIAAYNDNEIVYCRASSNANPATGSQTRLAFMAYVSNETTPTNVEFQYVRSVGSKTSSQPVDQVFVYKLTNANGGTWSVETRDMAPKLAAGTNTTVSYSSGTYTVSATDTTYSDFVGTDGSATGTHGLVPAPATTDVNKYLSSSGSWVSVPDRAPAEFYWYNNDLCSETATWTQVDPLDVEPTYLSHPIVIYNYSTYAYESVVSIDTTANIIEAVAVDLATREPRLVTYEFDESVTFKWVRTETSIPNITMTSTDPGEGGSLAAGNFIYVYDAGA